MHLQSLTEVQHCGQIREVQQCSENSVNYWHVLTVSHTNRKFYDLKYYFYLTGEVEFT